MEWSQEVVFEFLDLYEDEPIIWQPKHPQHKNRNLMNDAWVRIKQKLSIECTVAELKKKKESLMASFRPLCRKVKSTSKTGTGSEDVYKPTWFAYERMERFLHGVTVTRNTSNSENLEDSMGQEVTEEDSLMESGDGGTGVGGRNSNEIALNTESASANKEGGIEKSTDSNQTHFKAPGLGAKKNKRKAVDTDETNRRMEEAYDIMKKIQKTEPPKTTLCTAYGQLVAERLETLSEVNKIIVMNEIDNLFFRAKMGSMGPQYQSALSGQASPASLYSTSSAETIHTTQTSATSSHHQTQFEIPTPTCNDISSENYIYL